MDYIITLYNSPNCGAFLQAWALSRALTRLRGEEPTLIDVKARSIRKWAAKETIKSAQRLELRALPFYFRDSRAYISAHRLLKTESLKDMYDEDDVIIFGSDEIWNLSRKRIRNYPTLWGEGFSGGKRIAYAPSANGADYASCPEIDRFSKSIMQFSSLSARDKWTANQILKVTGSDAAVVCDPTLLLGIDDYREISQPSGIDSYVLVYSYGDMPEWAIEEVGNFAHSKGLRVVSADNYLSWCDYAVPCGPLGFLGLIDGAEFVVTDTFHGTVFSIIYRKRFVSYGKSGKTASFLADIGAPNYADVNGVALEDLFEIELSWDTIGTLLASYRDKSLGYLINAFE